MKKPNYEITLYRTTNGIFPKMDISLFRLRVWVNLESTSPYKTDLGAKRGILKVARKMGLVK